MKKLSLLLVMLVLTLPTYAWKPLFAGHRGSYRGVQNTAEAFRNGVDVYGYNGLECDIRVTSDGEYVIMHNETTNSLGGNLTVTEATLAQLKAETLRETRSGNTYTGTICTAAEYLDICNEKNVFPIIELKWTEGINNNDMSNFPGLIELVIEKGLLDKAIFLTSMKTSIEYIRTNYPAATCQFLTGEYWASHVDWCIKWDVAPSIQAGYFDASTVKQFHDLGFDVAMWTVNTEANYTKYGNMGVSMMTCDYLNANEMDELEDIDWEASEENTAVELDTQILWGYTNVDNNLPTDFPVGTGKYKSAQQATVIDGVFYANNYTTSELVAFDQNGAVATDYTGTDTHGITRDDAGNLIQRNDGLTATPNSMLIYKKGETEATTISFELINQGQTNFITASGDIFSAEGGYIYFFPNKQKFVNIVKIANGALVEVTASEQLSIEGSTAGMVYPMNNDPKSFIYQVRNVGYYLYKDGKDMGDYITGGSSTTAPGRNSSIGGAYINVGGHDIFIHTSGTNYNGGLTVRDMTADGEVLATFPAVGSLGYSGNPSVGTFITVEKTDRACYTAYAYTMGGGYVAYELKFKGDIAIPTVITTKTLWSKSYVDNTLPTDFPVGTGKYKSAQQATVIDGVFYANDYTTSELVAFDQNGAVATDYTGTDTHGITRDDAGNLIQRNDGLTSTPNSMLIYKNGETEATTISFELINQGQTNFISASGDIFSEDGGYIYFFPNKQKFVNIVKIANGELVEVTASEELSIEGSTAGMVYPMNNGPKSFIYQVRNVGYYLYKDGKDMGDYITGGSSTTAPGRNSSIGGAYLNINGHDIFIHTSGTNYNGGLTVRDMSNDGEVITSFPAVGSLGYSGNPSVGTFITPIEVAENYYIAYAYTMGGGYAAYEIALEGSSVEAPIIKDKVTTLNLFPNPTIDNVTINSNDAIESITVYSINGVKVMEVAASGNNSETIHVSALPQGLYIVKVNNNSVTRLIKK